MTKTKEPLIYLEQGEEGSGFNGAGFYFWDETSYLHGPYLSEDESREALDKYVKDLLSCQ